MLIILELSRDRCRDEIFDHVVNLNRGRIHARLQPKNANKLKPLSQGIQDLVKLAKPRKNAKALKQKLTALSARYRSADHCVKDSEKERILLKNLVQQSYDFCTPEGRTIEQTFAFYGFTDPKILENKHFRQMNKIGRYWGLCKDLVEVSRKYGRLFRSLELRPLPPYQKFEALVSNEIGRIRCHVHAEIQLLIFYLLKTDTSTLKPRVFGVSKSACYLCNLFILNHGGFFITKTHGRLYPRWTVPDLAAFNEGQLREVRRILSSMDNEIQRVLSQRKTPRPWPTESYIQLPARFLTSPITSDLGTLPSNASDTPTIIPPSPLRRQSGSNDTAAIVGPYPENFEKQILHNAIQPQEAIAESNSCHSVCAPSPKSLEVKNESPQNFISALSLDSSKRDTPLQPLSSILSWEYPVRRSLTASTPLHAGFDDLHLYVEIEGSSKGVCEIAKTSIDEVKELANVEDLQAMEPGEEKVFTRNADENSITLNFCHSFGRSIQLNLRWQQLESKD